MTDKELIDLYWQRDPTAIEESARRYGAYCFTVAKGILGNAEDAEECVNDTWLHAWNAMPPHRPTKLRMFLARLTRNLAFNRYQARTAQKRGGGEIELVLEELAECLPDPAGVAEQVDARELEECVRRFVARLPERDGNVFIRRCFFAQPVADIARRYGLSENNVMVILSRTRKKLKAYLIKEGFIHGSQ